MMRTTILAAALLSFCHAAPAESDRGQAPRIKSFRQTQWESPGSGHAFSRRGSLACGFLIMLMARQMAEPCHIDLDSKTTSELDGILQRLGDFVIANNAGKQRLDDYQTMFAKSEATVKAMTPEQLNGACPSIAGLMSNLKPMLASGELRKQLDHALSTPPDSAPAREGCL